MKTNISISQLSFVIFVSFVADLFLQRNRIARSHGWLRLSVNRAGVLDRAFNLAGHPFTLTGLSLLISRQKLIIACKNRWFIVIFMRYGRCPKERVRSRLEPRF
ncbi:MAG: hypothetical protein M3371_12120 [Acidobacteriota bacterium]|nr:hypothetical protein [Acidobacteriota bacterium]